MATKNQSRAKLVASAAICAALYAIVNAITSFISTPFGIGEFRPGVIVPAFFAIVVGPIPAALGAGIGSFVGDMISLVPAGRSTFAWALGAGAVGNFVGFLLLGLVYEKLKNWKGFIFGTTVGLLVGNFLAAAGVVLIGMFILPLSQLNPFPGMAGGVAGGLLVGLLLFWFGTMFPFAIIFTPMLVRLMRPFASQLTTSHRYPVLTEPNKKVLWGWSVLVSILVLAALLVALFAESSFVKADGGALAWESLFIISAASVLVVGAFIPQKPETKQAVQSQIQQS